MSVQGDSRIYKSSGEFSQYVHKATDRFWAFYEKLPLHVQKRADKQFSLLKENPSHGSLRFEKLDGYDHYWSARVNKDYRAVASKEEDGYVWFLIGKHDEVYNLLGR